MKLYIKVLVFLACLGGMYALTGCEKEKDFSVDYDIPWVVSKITNVTPLEAAPGQTITLTGENLGPDFVPPGTPPAFNDGSFFISTFSCEVISQSATSVVIRVPVTISDPSDISVSNLHNRTFVYEKQFIPILP